MEIAEFHNLKFVFSLIKFLNLVNGVCVYSLGMEGVDKEKVQRIVYEMSKGSKYFQNEERKEALMKQKIEQMRDRSAKLSSSNLSNYQKVCNYLRKSFRFLFCYP